MNIYRIKSNLVSDLHMIDFGYKKESNGHSKAFISAYVSQEVAEECIRNSCVAEWGSFIGIDHSGNEKTIFSGCVSNYSVGKNNQYYTVQLEIVSGTYLMDLIQNCYVHQNSSETYEQMIEDILKKYKDPFCIYDSSAKGAINQLVVQYEETDWAFINRLASSLNLPVISKTDHEGVSLEFGLNQKQEATTVNEIIELAQGKKGGKEYFFLKTYDYIEIGTPVIVNQKLMFVYSAEGDCKDGVLKNTYELRYAQEFGRKKIINESIVGASIVGSVSSISGDRVKVSLEEEKYHSRMLFPYATIYSSPDGSGWYCMPEVGDQVRLYFPTTDAKDAYVISAVHLPVENTTNPDDPRKYDENASSPLGDDTPPRTNPDYKSIKNKDGKEILFKPDSILITNNKGMYIELNDETGISIVSDKKISFSSDSSISIVSVNDAVQMAANSEIMLDQNGTSLQMKDDINVVGGKIKTIG